MTLILIVRLILDVPTRKSRGYSVDSNADIYLSRALPLITRLPIASKRRPNVDNQLVTPPLH